MPSLAVNRTAAASVAIATVIALLGGHFAVAQETTNAYSWNEDRVVNGNTITSTFTGKHQNYHTGKKWDDIDLTPRKEGGKYVIDKAPFVSEMPLKANGTMKFTAKNRYSVRDKKFYDDPPVSVTRTFPQAKNKDGVVTPEGILYQDAFGVGQSLLLQADTFDMRYIVKFDSAPTCNGTYDIQLRQTPDSGMVARKKNGQPVGNTDETVNGFNYKVNEFRGIGIPQAKIWDSGIKRQDVDIVGKWTPTKFIGKKVIPCEFFEDATYPVYTDDVFYPSAGQVSPVDGRAGESATGGAGWDAAHDGAGDNSFDSAANAAVYLEDDSGGTTIVIWRVIHLYDTSSLAGATVASCTVDLYAETKTNGDNDGQDYITIVDSTPASNTAIVNGDFAQVGAVDNPTKLTDDIDIGSITTSAYNTFTCNASGIAAVDSSGITKLGAREGHDVEDAPIAGSSVSQVTFSMADTGGASQDPKLTVTASVAVVPQPFFPLLFGYQALKNLFIPLVYAR